MDVLTLDLAPGEGTELAKQVSSILSGVIKILTDVFILALGQENNLPRVDGMNKNSNSAISNRLEIRQSDEGHFTVQTHTNPEKGYRDIATPKARCLDIYNHGLCRHGHQALQLPNYNLDSLRIIPMDGLAPRCESTTANSCPLLRKALRPKTLVIRDVTSTAWSILPQTIDSDTIERLVLAYDRMLFFNGTHPTMPTFHWVNPSLRWYLTQLPKVRTLTIVVPSLDFGLKPREFSAFARQVVDEVTSLVDTFLEMVLNDELEHLTIVNVGNLDERMLNLISPGTTLPHTTQARQDVFRRWFIGRIMASHELTEFDCLSYARFCTLQEWMDEGSHWGVLDEGDIQGMTQKTV